MLDLPRPLPHLSTQVPCTLLAQRGNPEWRGGGRGRYGVPTPTLPPTNLTLKTPGNAPTPTRMLAGLSLLGLSPERNTGGGRGLGGLAAPYPNCAQPSPQGASPPSDVRAAGRRLPWREGGTVGVGSGFSTSSPG